MRPIVSAGSANRYDAGPSGAPGALDHRGRQEWGEPLRHHHGARPGPAAAVGLGEGLVQVRVDDVEAQLSGLHPAEQRVEVRPVAVDHAAGVADHLDHGKDVVVEEPQGAGLGEHEARDVVPHHRAEGADVGVAVRVGGQRDDVEARHRGRGRIGPVGAVRHQHPGAGEVAPGAVVGAGHQHPGELPLGPRHRRQGGRRHPGDLGEDLLEVVHERQGPLHRGLGLEGVYL